MQGLNTLGGNYSKALGINDNHQIVGGSFISSGQSRAFLWTAAAGMQNLGTLKDGNGSEANGINNAGQVVGSSNTVVNGKLVWHGFTWTETGGMQDLSLGLGPDYLVNARALNLGGDPVGYYYSTANFIYHAFWWAGTVIDLGGYGGSTEAKAINNKQQIVGYSSDSKGISHAFLWDSVNKMLDLGLLQGHSPPVAGSMGFGLNNLGQVVGTCDSRAFLWTAADGMQDLNGLVINPPVAPQFLSCAYAINDSGQIVGETGGVNNHAALGHAFLLTPIPDNPPGVAWMNLLLD